MKSQTLSQFQSVMYELNEFGRGKDRVKRKAKVAIGRAGQKVKQLATKTGDWLGNPVSKAASAYESNAIHAAAGKSQNAAIKSTGSLGNKLRQTGAAIKNVAGTRAGKIGMGLAAGAALAGGAAALLKNRNKNKKK